MKARLATKVAELKQVSKRFGQIEALKDIDLSVYAGEVLAVLGPNGAGKTTAINLLLGMQRPSQGEARLFSKDPQHSESRMRVGSMLQISGVPPTLKVQEHIELFSSYYPKPLAMPEVLELAGLLGLEKRQYGKLSGGQQQRLHLALALSGDPDLIFLDEPTTGLDVASRRGLWEGIRSFIHKGRTVVLTSHYLEEADALADRIAVIHQGKLIAEGSPVEIKAKTAGRKIRVISTLSLEFIEGLEGVSLVRREGAALEILAKEAEPVVYKLLQEDPNLKGLEVTSAGLEDAFLSLTEGLVA